MNLLRDIHKGLEQPLENSKYALVRGNYSYYHYVCDEINDKGWGCGYRTLQTICSWIRNQHYDSPDGRTSTSEVPTIYEIQKALVEIGDKKEDFLNSKEWIGTLEVSYVIDYFYKIPCRILHCRSSKDLKQQDNEILLHFKEHGSPIMMGGDRDCSSKGILGIHKGENETYLLVLDPHFSGKANCEKDLQDSGWVKWLEISMLDNSSFYNLCCPLVKV